VHGTILDAVNADSNGGNGFEIDHSQTVYATNDLGNENGGNGLVVNNGKSIVISFSTFELNQLSGVIFNATTGSTFDSSADLNFMSGIELHGSNGNTLSGEASSNSIYGIWIAASSNNVVDQVLASVNNQTGIYIGCSPINGPISASCSGVGPSNSNRIIDNVPGGSPPHQKYGIAIDLGDSSNVVYENFADADLIDDGFDANTNCDGNLWANNLLSRTNNDGCVQ
jgi:parallel beta-helix repeat protein